MALLHKKQAGLRGQCAGTTSLCTVGKQGHGLSYCGYNIEDLARYSSFEEVVYLLFHGELPNSIQLIDLKSRLKKLRSLSKELKAIIEKIPKETHPMEMLRTAVSVLGNLEPEYNLDAINQQHASERLVAIMPAMLIYWYQYSHNGIRIETTTDADSLAEHFLKLLHQKKPDDNHISCLNASLILYAEHEFNASTFTARVCASTLSDMHSCVAAAIGALRGNLHGGANEAAMDMIKTFKSISEAEVRITEMLKKKQKIMGFGHAVYTTSDPRNDIIKKWAERLAKNSTKSIIYDISVAIEALMWKRKKLFCNADFFHASAYYFMDIPIKLFTPIFVCSRVSGWTAHVMEQRKNNRIIRPSAEYIGYENRAYLAMEQRNDLYTETTPA